MRYDWKGLSHKSINNISALNSDNYLQDELAKLSTGPDQIGSLAGDSSYDDSTFIDLEDFWIKKDLTSLIQLGTGEDEVGDFSENENQSIIDEG